MLGWLGHEFECLVSSWYQVHISQYEVIPVTMSSSPVPTVEDTLCMTFFDMGHFPHRHRIHSQQPVHCTKPRGGDGRPNDLPQYTIQCEG